tara:strand:+ start:12469 stop:13569 length:1101 start_codon:yes stop_codon:yes gene_type:complete
MQWSDAIRLGSKRSLAVWALLLLTLWVGHEVYRDVFLVADTPRPVTPRGSLADLERQNVEAFQRIAPSVAYIFTRPAGNSPFNQPAGGGTGSGFLWDRAGHVVTNHHVVANAAAVAVRLDDGEPVRATVIGSAPDSDLAVLRLSDLPSGLQPIPVGSSGDLQVGQSVLAIGNPFGLSRTLTTGIVSALDRRLPTPTGREIAGVIQTDAAINPGNSGGPLLDSAGRLIGVNTAIISGSGSSAGIGFAVPVDVVNRIVPQLIANGKAPRPGIGVSVASEEFTARLGIDGVVIADVIADGSAGQAGLRGLDRRSRRLGDVITHVGETPVHSLAEFATALDRVGIGNAATLTVLRGDRSMTVSVTVMDIS